MSKTRRNKFSWGRRLLGTYIVAWLAVMVQPCVMAMGAEHDCQHCPPVEVPCELATSQDCAFDDQAATEWRGSQLKDSPIELPAAAPPCDDASERNTASLVVTSASVLLKPGGPPLNVLYCVYLK